MENKQDDQKNYQKDTKQIKSIGQTASTKNFSILPDLVTGWRPKVLKIHPPILIKYKEPYINNLITNLNNVKNNKQNKQNKFNNIVYLGPRHYNSFSFHNKVPHDYHVRFAVKNQDLPEDFQDEIQKYKKIQNRPFVGMNPSYCQNKQNIIFESNFQSGNLDLVIEGGRNQYDLFLRPDTNTCGHTQWFYFKIKVKKQLFADCQTSQQNISKKIKFNICNNKKWKTLYGKGMKPYVYSHKLKQEKEIGWHQQGNNVTYRKYQNKYNFQNNQNQQQKTINQSNSQNINNNNQNNVLNKNTQNSKQINSKQLNYFCLSFQYQLQYDQDCIEFAYCPPYTYSQLKKDISKLKKKVLESQNLQIVQERLCISLSGLEVPLLTITNSTSQSENQRDKNKKILFATARIHPGQTNGSHVMNGFLNFIVSPEASSLRNKCIFKIVPMINPDGVILGNFRTGLAGKDLNRQFKVKNLQLLPEISSIKEYITKLKFQKGTSLIYYLDIHGHSTKKNVFMYGPEYDMWDGKFEKAKILPKIISFKTPMFKLNSCIYKIANYKKSTARAFILGYIPFCYTIQSSIGIYVNEHGQNTKFTIEKWQEMGRKIGEALDISLDRLNQENLKALMKKNKSKKSMILKQIDLQTNSRQFLSQDNTLRTQSSVKEINLVQQTNNQITSEHTLKPLTSSSLQPLNSANFNTNNNKKYLQPIKHFKIKQKQISLDFPQINEQKRQSDGESDGKSDCESQTNDFSKKEYEEMSKDILRVIKDFQKVVGLNKIQLKQSQKQKINLCKKKVIKHRKQSSSSYHKNTIKSKNVSSSKNNNFEEMKLVPSLKHKLSKLIQDGFITNNAQKMQKMKRNNSEKKINYNSLGTNSFQRSFVLGSRAV